MLKNQSFRQNCAVVCKYFVIKIALLSLELVNIKDVGSICTFYRKNTFNNSLQIEFKLNYIQIFNYCRAVNTLLLY